MRLIDMHCDTIWMLMREEGANLRNNCFCVDIEKLKSVGSMAQFFACFIYLNEIASEERWEIGYQLALDMIKRGKAEFAACSDKISLASNYDDVIKNYAGGKMSAILTIEEGGILNNNMNRLCELYKQGVRLMTLTWNHENCIGYPNSKDELIMQKGLKPFGIEVIEKMNELGMIIDVSHLSDGGFWDVMELSKKPIVASHSCARALTPHPRNLTDEMIKAMASKGGVCGINFCPVFIAPDLSANNGWIEDGKLEDIVRHIMHLYNMGGSDFVAIGTDFDGIGGKLDIAGPQDMDKLFDALLKKGMNAEDVEKIAYKNAERLIKETLK